MKTEQLELVRLSGETIGCIMRDSKGYFYRPKRNTIPKGKHNKWDSDYYSTVRELKDSLYS